MADNTKIEWTEATWNPITGCSLASPGCTNCYAMKLAGTRMKHHPSRAGLTQDSKAGPVWNGEVRFNEEWLTQPLHWKRPRMIFVCAHGDLFHESVLDAWIDRVFAVMALAPQHTFQVLTKRSKRMREYFSSKVAAERMARVILDFADTWGITGVAQIAPLGNRAREEDESFVVLPLPNVWLGVSVEDQKRADERILDLLATPAAVRWISGEPLLGPVNMEAWLDPAAFCQSCDDGEGYGNRCNRRDISRDEQCPYVHAVQTVTEHGPFENGQPSAVTCDVMKLDWVVVGGESGPRARPMHPDWARSLRDQCASAAVPFFFKQWGEWAPVCAMSEEQIEACYYPAPEEHPEASRREKLKSIVLHRDGACFRDSGRYEFGAHMQGSGSMTMFPVGKKASGRLLDGIEHNAMPHLDTSTNPG